ncbi:MAG TPA: hypothetical protein VF607_07975 [Verrucomicrobiae bacterium]
MKRNNNNGNPRRSSWRGFLFHPQPWRRAGQAPAPASLGPVFAVDKIGGWVDG